MLSDSIAVISIFLLVPALIAFFAVRGYRQAVCREKQEAAEKHQAEARQNGEQARHKKDRAEEKARP